MSVAVISAMLNISIHALREESDSSRRNSTCSNWISIHALREESDSSRDRATSR